MLMNTYILDKNIMYTQPTEGFRGGLDAILLAMASPIIRTGKALDVGCGAGAVGLVYASLTGDTVHIMGVEKTDIYVTFARKNIQDNGFKNRMNIVHTDISHMQNIADMYDVVMTNPPYEPAHVSTPSYNPLKKVAHMESTADLQTWIRFCIKAVKPRKAVVMIHKMSRLADIVHILHPMRVGIKVRPIITKAGDNPTRVLIHITKNTNTPFVMYPPLVIYDGGTYTDTANAILHGKAHILWD